jgi:hypothetical protein
MKKTTLYRILSILLFCTLLAPISAQVPGYIGKRFLIQAGIHVFPQFSIFPVNVVQPYSNYFISGINYRLELGTEFVISRKSSIGINGQYFCTAAAPLGGGYPYSNRYAIEGGSVGAVFKTYFGQWIAPVGPYFKAEGGAIFYSVSDPQNNYGGSFPSQTIYNGYVGFGFGRTHIFANRISLDYGGEIAFVFPPYTSDADNIVPSTNLRMAVHYLGSVYVKVGVIL